MEFQNYSSDITDFSNPIILTLSDLTRKLDLNQKAFIGVKLTGLVSDEEIRTLRLLKCLKTPKLDTIAYRKFVLFDPLLHTSLFAYEKIEGIGTIFMRESTAKPKIEAIKQLMWRKNFKLI